MKQLLLYLCLLICSYSFAQTSAVKLAPNPCSTTLFFIGANNLDPYIILNTNGKTLQAGVIVNNGIKVSNLQNGLYIIKLITKNKVHTLKFIKQ